MSAAASAACAASPTGRRGCGRARLRAAHASLAAGALCLVVVLSSCTVLRNTLGTSNSACYVALPDATTAVHGVGHLEGVRLEKVPSLERISPLLLHAAMDAPGPPVHQVCLVGFTGRFTSGDVEHGVGDPTGRTAVVELEYPDNAVLATLVTGTVPVHFGHSHIGPG